MTAVSKFLWTGTAIQTAIVLYGIYFWFFQEPSDSFKTLMLYAGIPIVSIWLLTIYTTYWILYSNKDK